jgi:membrane associated rhomboid family serine protease
MRRYAPAPPSQTFGPGMVTPMVRMLIWANVGLFVVSQIVPSLTLYFGLIPRDVLTRLWLWQPFTYLFLHGSFLHIVFNMLALWMFGTELERLWGSKFFLRYYFVTGVGAGAAMLGASLVPSVFGAGIYVTPTIGASGAVYGLLMAFAIYYPTRPLFLFPFPIPIQAKYFVLIIGGFVFFSSLNDTGGGVAHMAHLGGLVVGYVYLKRGGGGGLAQFGRFGVMAEIKYRYLRWKMGRLRRKFNVYPGGNDNDRVH